MYIKSFHVNFDKNKRLWLIIFSAMTIAIVLIISAFIVIYNAPGKNIASSGNINLKDIVAYEAKYQVSIKSNKNQNHYQMEEIYEKKESGDFFKFIIKNDEEIITYTINSNILMIESNKEKLSYTLEEYIVNKENLISIATFIDLYQKILDTTLEEKKYFHIDIEEYDNKIAHKISINFDHVVPENFLYLANVSMLEVITDRQENKIKEYIIYDKNQNAYIDIIYDNFLIK